jgi:hypothetical protein
MAGISLPNAQFAGHVRLLRDPALAGSRMRAFLAL